MRLKKIAILGLLLIFGLNAMANEVVIYNKSNHPIPVKYELAYHNLKQPVVLGHVSQGIVYGNNSINVKIPTRTNFENSGIIILAVKKELTGDWLYSPESIKEFDGKPGCWMRTSKEHHQGNIILSYQEGAGKHGKITCSTR